MRDSKSTRPSHPLAFFYCCSQLLRYGDNNCSKKKKKKGTKIKASCILSHAAHHHSKHCDSIRDTGQLAISALCSQVFKQPARMIIVTCILSSVLQTHQHGSTFATALHCILGNYCFPITTQLVNIYQINKQQPVN